MLSILSIRLESKIVITNGIQINHKLLIVLLKIKDIPYIYITIYCLTIIQKLFSRVIILENFCSFLFH